MILTHPSAGTYSIVDASTFALLLTVADGHPRRIAFDGTGKTTMIANESGSVTFLHWP